MPSPSPASTARPPGSPCSTTWPATETFQPAWAARAALLAAAGHHEAAERARLRALELTVDPLERDHLATRMPRI